jgi:hypothetical protein
MLPLALEAFVDGRVVPAIQAKRVGSPAGPASRRGNGDDRLESRWFGKGKTFGGVGAVSDH